MKLQIYANVPTAKGRKLVCVDEVNGDLEAVISDLLNHCWEDETDGNPVLLVCDDNGTLLASITTVQVLGPVCGVVEVYRANRGNPIEHYRVEYLLTEEGGYDRTQIERIYPVLPLGK